jgi:hypothetical protein
MVIKQLAENATADIVAAIGADGSQSAEISGIVEKALIEAVLDVRARCVDTIKGCCSDADLAHKIAREIDQKEKALVANLSSMR